MRYQGSCSHWWAGAGGLMISRSLRGPIIGLVTLILAGPAAGQSLDKGKTPPSYSRRTARHVTNRREARKSAGFRSRRFLREHTRPAGNPRSDRQLSQINGKWTRAGGNRRQGRRKAKSEATKKPAAKPRRKGAEKKPDAASEEPKPLGYWRQNRKRSDTKANAPATGDPSRRGREKPE
jgi:hypothetical protein